eukprot:1736286-Pleurochrysis_carterae.AAC.2
MSGRTGGTAGTSTAISPFELESSSECGMPASSSRVMADGIAHAPHLECELEARQRDDAQLLLRHAVAHAVVRRLIHARPREHVRQVLDTYQHGGKRVERLRGSNWRRRQGGRIGGGSRGSGGGGDSRLRWAGLSWASCLSGFSVSSRGRCGVRCLGNERVDEKGQDNVRHAEAVATAAKRREVELRQQRVERARLSV